MEKNYRHFDDNEENKLIYTTVHKEYVNEFFFFDLLIFSNLYLFEQTNLIEKYLEMQLKKRIENFSMTDFMNDLMLVY